MTYGMSFSPFHASSQILSPLCPPREFLSQTVDLSHLQFCFSRFQLPMVNYSLEISPTIRYLERERETTSYNFYYSILLYLFYLIKLIAIVLTQYGMYLPQIKRDYCMQTQSSTGISLPLTALSDYSSSHCKSDYMSYPTKSESRSWGKTHSGWIAQFYLAAAETTCCDYQNSCLPVPECFSSANEGSCKATRNIVLSNKILNLLFVPQTTTICMYTPSCNFVIPKQNV